MLYFLRLCDVKMCLMKIWEYIYIYVELLSVIIVCDTNMTD